jgi:hypothetical protein
MLNPTECTVRAIEHNRRIDRINREAWKLEPSGSVIYPPAPKSRLDALIGGVARVLATCRPERQPAKRPLARG